MIYSVTADAPAADFEARVRTSFPSQCYCVMPGPPTTWFVFAPALTTKQVMDAITPNPGSDGNMIVTGIQGWWGYHSKELWEWIQTRKVA